VQGFQAFEDIVGDPYEVTRKPIRGWPGYYAGSDGRIYSLHSGDFEPVAEWEGGRKRCPYQKVTLYRTRCVWWHRDGKRGRRGRVAEKRNFFVFGLFGSDWIVMMPRCNSSGSASAFPGGRLLNASSVAPSESTITLPGCPLDSVRRSMPLTNESMNVRSAVTT